MRRAFLVAFAAGVASSAGAYPSFIGYGFSSCLSCHFNAWGGGPLNDHGRAVNAVAIAAKPFYAPETSDEDLGASSGLLGRTTLPRWVRAQASYRGLYYASQIQARTRHDAENQRADLALVLSPTSWIWASGTIGAYRPQSDYPRRGWYSREHYLAVELADAWRVYAGLTELVYGVRLPDYDTYARRAAGVSATNQSHGVTLHYAKGGWEAGLQALLGNFLRPEAERVKGLSFMTEDEFADRLALGFSLAALQEAAGERRYLGAVHARAGVGEGSSILSEFGVTRDSLHTSPYFLLQTMSRIARGWNFLLTSEFRTDQIFGPAVRLFRIAPGLLYFPMSRLELRTDLRATREIGGPEVGTDGVDLTMQVHLWF